MKLFICFSSLLVLLISCKNNRLNPGDKLKIKEVLVSDNRQYKLVLQEDGNLVLYKGINEPIWASNTANKQITMCIMQEDGNLVLYDDVFNAYWATNTINQKGAHLILQDDANLVVYESNKSIWSSNTAIINP
jgi:hypothetical protein